MKPSPATPGVTSEPGRSRPRSHGPEGRRRLATRCFRGTCPPSQHTQPLATRLHLGSSTAGPSPRPSPTSVPHGGPHTAAHRAAAGPGPSSAVESSSSTGVEAPGLGRPLAKTPAPRAWACSPPASGPSACLSVVFAVCAETGAELDVPRTNAPTTQGHPSLRVPRCSRTLRCRPADQTARSGADGRPGRQDVHCGRKPGPPRPARSWRGARPPRAA